MLKRGFSGTATSLSEASSDDDSDYAQPPPPKNGKFENYSDKSFLMMQKMGYKVDTGLGKEGTGRLEPVEASTQKGRRGLGLKLDSLDTAALKWSPEMENIQLRESAIWISDYSNDLETLSVDELKSWMCEDMKKMTIDDETMYCEPQVLENVLAQKTIFDNLGADDMRNARTRSNPFE